MADQVLQGGQGCPECQAASGLERRRFLGLAAAAGVTTWAGVTGSVFREVALAASGSADNILIVVSLRGGADGLSLVVPHGDPGYLNARPRIAIPANRLVASNAMFGLHPKLAPLVPLWNQGKFGAVHAVGLPHPNRSHFSAMEEIEDADPGSTERRGWLNRMIGLDHDRRPQQAVQMGAPLVPTSLYGPQPVLATTRLKDLQMPGPSDPEGHRRTVRARHLLWDDKHGAIGRGARSAMKVVDSLARLAGSTAPPHNGAKYPEGDFGRSLAQTATMLRADVGAEVVTIDYGNWDMHVGLGTMEWGAMLNTVDEFAHGMAAFFKDLGGLASKVTVVTLSEFGRRVQENGDYGLDHGYGNVMLMFGAGVAGGKVHGSWPGLGAGKLIDGDLAVTHDYRSVLWEVLKARFPALNLSKVFPNFQPENIGSMKPS